MGTVWKWIKRILKFFFGGLGLLISAPFVAVGELGYQIFERIKDGAWPDDFPVLHWWHQHAKNWWDNL